LNFVYFRRPAWYIFKSRSRAVRVSMSKGQISGSAQVCAPFSHAVFWNILLLNFVGFSSHVVVCIQLAVLFLEACCLSVCSEAPLIEIRRVIESSSPVTSASIRHDSSPKFNNCLVSGRGALGGALFPAPRNDFSRRREIPIYDKKPPQSFSK